MKMPQGLLACLAGTMMVLASGAGATIIERNVHHPVPQKVVVAQSTIAKLGLDIKASCRGRTAIFSFINKGAPWPGVAAIQIFRVSDRSVIFQHTMRMAKEQRGSFRLDGKRNPGGEIGFFVDPTWAHRPFTVDAKADCN